MNTDTRVWLPLVVMIVLVVAFWATRKRTRNIYETTPGGPYTVIITDEEIACEHPKRTREHIRWDAITEVRLVTTTDGPWQPDMWYLFMGDSGGCSVPSEAKDFEKLWPEFKKRFAGLDYEAMITAGTSDAQKTLWKRGSNQAL